MSALVLASSDLTSYVFIYIHNSLFCLSLEIKEKHWLSFSCVYSVSSIHTYFINETCFCRDFVLAYLVFFCSRRNFKKFSTLHTWIMPNFELTTTSSYVCVLSFSIGRFLYVRKDKKLTRSVCLLSFHT